MKHKLKIFPAFFDAVVSGEKNFEVRDNNDRGFKHGDIVRLCEFTKEGMYTGREIEKRITYVSNYGQLDGYVVFGMADVVPNVEGEPGRDKL